MYVLAMVLAMVVMGIVFLISQVLVLREFLLAFKGDEFVIGIVLGSWLLFEALGSGLSGRRADRAANPLGGFVVLQSAISFLLPATLLLIRLNRHWLGSSPWEAASYMHIWGVSLVVLGPLGLLNGAAFSYGCRLTTAGGLPDRNAAGKVYALESLGAFLGGLAFTFVLVGRAQSIQVAFFLGAASMGCALLLVRLAGGERGSHEMGGAVPGACRARQVACLSLMTLFLVGSVSPLCGRIHRWSMKQRWLPLTLEESRDSIFGNIAVLKLDQQQVVYQNGIPSITFPYPDQSALEVLVDLPLLAHPDPRKVLIMGGGIGGALAEAQKHPIEVLYYTELDPLLIRMTEEVATPSVRKELEDPRTRVLYQDGRFFLRRTHQKMDVVILNMPDAATLQLNRFFTKEFFRFVRRVLEPGGLLAFSMPGSTSYLSEEILRINRCVLDTLKQIFPHVRVLPGERFLFLASRDLPVESLVPELLASRLESRGLETAVVRPYFLSYLMDPWQGRWLDNALQRTPGVRTNRDLTPALLSYMLAYRNAEVQPGLRRILPSLERMRAGVLPLLLLFMALPFGLWLNKKRGDRTPAVSFAVFSTGFVGMAAEMVAILAFQSVYGYLYQWIGLLIAAFMLGLACGAFVATRLFARVGLTYRLLCGLEGLQLGLLLLSAWGILALHGLFLEKSAMMEAPKAALFCFNMIVGLLVGSEFVLANREAANRVQGGVSTLGGRFYALDLAGGWFGTVMASVLFVPLFGIRNTLLFAAAVKGCSLYYLYRSR